MSVNRELAGSSSEESQRSPPSSMRFGTARFLSRVVFSSLLALIALTAIPYGTVEDWSITLFECACFALGIVSLVEAVLSGNWLTKEHRVLIPLVALIAFCFIQSLSLGFSAGVNNAAQTLSSDPYETYLVTLRLLALTVACALLLRYTSSRRRLRALIYLIIGVSVASALSGLLRQTTQRDKMGFILPYLVPNSGYGQFINRNHFAFLMEMALGLILGLMIGEGVRRDRILVYLGAAIPVWTALILSNSRGGILSMLCQILFTALIFTIVVLPRQIGSSSGKQSNWLSRLGQSVPIRLALIGLLVLAMAAGVLFMGGDQLANRMDFAKDNASTVSDAPTRDGDRREDIWRATLSLIKANPITGVGFGGYWTAIPAYHDASGQVTPQQAHNDYLELLASGGLCGAALGIWFLIGLVKASRERLRSPDSFRSAACFGAIVGLFGVAVHSFVDFGLHITVNALVCMALIAIAVAPITDEKADIKKPLRLRRMQKNLYNDGKVIDL